ncbi:tRNA (adenosine(37)-N6)-threonylcarbamoyltransferase complex ATPase subunit type 1 TsaE [Glutamicibacter sp. PS]|uniref:tRNA (adenosine(37)-N6)-threonylcarbamoyltransferase complex ATPase subunit type 1 TsaE n=1 Tax=Glutamicibacter sp. PS TaxID=3075634 RepID=UPI00284EEAF1|nr:tRNA (adenosine(37)-N6)-threonylcarbamoyltransferase complex ATPase subunit type 1 TsaE [Glutamicibacter sp. PS]MDR4532246.1 tRNA (adenosine(37)-N6)-threonylcarbamoyltransferase complex ATPase subunit type 1 TsaE [Glutamicibacter sp. PS]
METNQQQLQLELTTLEATERVGHLLGAWLQAGDLVILTGALGAGKTTLTQSLGEGLEVRSGIISPTFVLSRHHPSLVEGPGLVHVDAYRLQAGGEIDTLDLESTLGENVTVVEWGIGKVEHLSESRLEISLDREQLAPKTAAPWEESEDELDEPRSMVIRGIGPRWAEGNFQRLANALELAVGEGAA